MNLRERAEEWLKQRFPEYQKDASIMHVDVEVYSAGFREAIRLAAETCDTRVRCQHNYDMCREAEIIARLVRSLAEGGGQ